VIAALFDIDGTLIARNSAPMYMRHLRRTGQARRRDVARTLYYLARYKLGLLDIERALRVSMAWISGRVEELVQRDCEEWYGRAVRPYVYPAMAAAVDAHRRAGHVPAILTSATRYLAEPLAADLGIPHVLVTQLVVRDGRSPARPSVPSATAPESVTGRSASPSGTTSTSVAATSTRIRSRTCPSSSGLASRAS